MKFSHSELVDIAGKWLKRQGCGVVLKELVASSTYGEIPDAIGFRSDGSFVIECKTSRSDFFTDQKKQCRAFRSNVMGSIRIYLCEHGLIKKEELPEDWGLMYVNEKGKIEIIKGKESFPETNVPNCWDIFMGIIYEIDPIDFVLFDFINLFFIIGLFFF